MSRKWGLIVAAGVAVALTVSVVVLNNLNNPASGRLRHDDSLQTMTVEKQWRVEKMRYDTCFEISFEGELSGNARSTWGLTGPTTVWENLRVHDTIVSVEAHELHADGRCEGEAVGDWPIDEILVGQAWRTGRHARRGFKKTRGVFRDGPPVTIHFAGIVARLPGDSYDRGDAYRTTLSVYVGPSWRRSKGVSVSDGSTVKHTVELPAG